MTKRILVLGNTIADHVFELAEPLERDEKSKALEYTLHPGGQASNAAHALALLGHRVEFVGAFGDDANSDMCRDAMMTSGISLDHSQFIAACPHQTSAIMVHGAQRSITEFRGDRLRLDQQMLTEIDLSRFDLVYSDGHEWEAFLIIARAARASGIAVVTDLENIPADDGGVFAHVDHLVAPGDVLCRLAGEPDCATALQSLRDRFGGTFVATLGDKGSIGLGPDQATPCAVAAHSIVPVDTTGAGDAFHAGYINALLQASDLEACLAHANHVAAEKCLIPGPRLSRYSPQPE